MQTQNNRRPLRLALAGAVVLAVAAVVFSQMGGKTAQIPRTVSTTPAWVEARNRTAAQVAALEKRLHELNLAYGEAMKKIFLMRQQLQALQKEALAREVEAARRAVEDALDHHPIIMAMRQQRDQLNKDSFKLSDQQAVVLTKLHANTAQRRETNNKERIDLWAQLGAARQAYLQSVGKKDVVHLSPEEAKTFGDIQDKYVQMAKDSVKKEANWQPDDTEKQLTAEYQALGEQRIATDARYTEVGNDIPETRARLRAEDPVIAALDRVLTEKNARLLAADNASPEMAPLLQQLQAVGRQRSEVAAQLMKLRRSSAGASATATAAANARTNGQG